MKLIDACIRYPVTVLVGVILCGLFGTIALLRLPTQMMPTIDRPEISISTPYPGAGPLEVEEEVTRRQEQLLNTVENLRELRSTSYEGFSYITLSYDWGVNKDVARLDASEKIAAVFGLPDDVDEPIVRALSSDQENAIGWVALLTDRTVNETRPLAEDEILPSLERVEGVGQVRFFGGEEHELHVEVDLRALAQRGLTVQQLRTALLQENRNLKAGAFDEGKLRHSVRTVGRYRQISDVEETIVARTPGGPVRVRDVARVSLGYADREAIVRQSGKTTLFFGIQPKTGANTLDVMAGVRKVIDDTNHAYGSRGIRMLLVHDDSDYIEESIDLVTHDLIIGSILAAAVLLIFLRSANAVVVLALTIPVTVISTFIFIWGLGRSLNIISLAGLTFGSGMTLDSAIVVVENIFRHRELGKGPMRAARDGTVEVWGAIFASALTAIAVFLPLVLIQDEAGQIFRDIAIAISISNAIALVVAVTLIPMLAARLLGKGELGSTDRVSRYLSDALVRFLEPVLARPARRLALIGGIMLPAFGVIGLAMWYADELVAYMPQGNRNFIFVPVRVPPGNNLIHNDRVARLIEARIHAQPEVAQTFTVVETNSAFMGVILKPEHTDKEEIHALLERLRGLTSDVPGAGVSVIQAPLIRAGGIGRGSLAVQIRGEELVRIQALASDLEKRLKEVPGVLFVNPSFELGKPEYVVDVNRVRAAELGLSVQDVGSVVESVVYGTLTGRYDNAGREIDLRVRAPAGSIQSARDVERAVIYTPTGRTVQLGDIAAIRAELGPTEIQHVDMYRSASLYVNADDQVPLGEMIQRIDAVLAEVRTGLPLGYSLRVAGQADDLQRMLEAFRPSMLLAMLITFLLLASLFESFVIPAVIFVSVPFAISGGLLGLFLLRLVDPTMQLDTITMLGFVILLGVVVNNAILVVHQGLNELAQGGDGNEALLTATASRVRPILMTLVTTVFGMSPLVIFSGSGSELYRGLGAVLLGGLVVSTVFTLVLTPAVMSLVLDWLPRDQLAAQPADA